MEQWEQAIQTVLGEDNKRNKQNSMRFRQYLLSKLRLPVRVTGREDFLWEEKYVIGGWDKREYEVLKQINPSYTDEYDLMNIQDPNNYDFDLMVKARRVSDRKTFIIGLSWLEALDKQSNAVQLLETYSVWHCNY